MAASTEVRPVTSYTSIRVFAVASSPSQRWVNQARIGSRHSAVVIVEFAYALLFYSDGFHPHLLPIPPYLIGGQIG